MDSIPSLNEKEEPKKKKFFQSIYKDNIFKGVRKIKQIEDGRILILYNKLFEIIDIKTKKHIFRTILKLEKDNNNRYYDNMFIDFIELKNKNLILWSSGKIFYYNKIGNKLKKEIN